jgi:hypothetical protein
MKERSAPMAYSCAFNGRQTEKFQNMKIEMMIPAGTELLLSSAIGMQFKTVHGNLDKKLIFKSYRYETRGTYLSILQISIIFTPSN